MAKFEKEIKEIEGIVIELACSGCDIDVNMDDIREMLENPDEFDILPSDLVDDYMFNVDNMKDELLKLYNKLDKLQDLLFESDL
jgi:hypothetical protein